MTSIPRIFPHRVRIGLFLGLAIVLLVATLVPNTPLTALPTTAKAEELALSTDSYEPNNTTADAKSLVSSPMSGLTLSSGNDANPEDTDWYSFALIGNSTIKITVVVSGTDSTTPAAVQLIGYDSSGQTEIGSRETNAATSNLTINNTTAGSVTYKILVKNPDGLSSRQATYTLSYQSTANATNTPTPGTATSTATATPTPSSTPTLAASGTTGTGSADGYEPNNTPQDVFRRNTLVSYVNANARLSGANFYPPTNTISVLATRDNGDIDWYFFYVRKAAQHGGSGGIYRMSTTVSAGVDTELSIYRDKNCSTPTGELETDNENKPRLFHYSDDIAPLKRESQVEFVSEVDCIYWARLVNKDPVPRGGGQTYDVVLVEFLNTPTPATATPQSTAYPQKIDSFEYNGTFETASLIAPGQKYAGLNFVPVEPQNKNATDNDYFRLPVKQGIYYSCETLNLGPGVDTNMIVYNQDRVGIGGNDDASSTEKFKGAFGSRVTWLSGYTGYAYVLLGEVILPYANETSSRSYELQCKIGVPETPTPIGGPPTATPTQSPVTPPPAAVQPPQAIVPPSFGNANPNPPTGPIALPTEVPTDRPPQNLAVRKLDGPPKLGAAAQQATPTAAPRLVSINAQVFMDYNQNGLADSNEGIGLMSLRLADDASGRPIAQMITDNQGRASASITNNGPIKVTVPLLGYSTVIAETQNTIKIAVPAPQQTISTLP